MIVCEKILNLYNSILTNGDIMLSNFHTHTSFCDGENTPEEVVLSAIEKGFSSIGFSSHGYTEFDLRYCLKDTKGYITEINRLKEKYRNKIEIYLGVEEDAFYHTDRSQFDYIIGSSHYFNIYGKYYPIDSNYDYFKECLKVFEYNVLHLAECYYSNFCDYILNRKPDIIGHFDLITKFDEMDASLFLENKQYNEIAQKYMIKALSADCIFEVNTGAISRGYRKSPYPHENLLYIIKKYGGKLILSSDSHNKSTLDYYFTESRKYLKDIGFECVYTQSQNQFIKDYL